MSEAVADPYQTNGMEAGARNPLDAPNAVLGWLELYGDPEKIPAPLPELTIMRLNALYPAPEGGEQRPVHDLLGQAAVDISGLRKAETRLDARFFVAGFELSTLKYVAPQYGKAVITLRKAIKRHGGVIELTLASTEEQPSAKPAETTALVDKLEAAAAQPVAESEKAASPKKQSEPAAEPVKPAKVIELPTVRPKPLPPNPPMPPAARVDRPAPTAKTLMPSPTFKTAIINAGDRRVLSSKQSLRRQGVVEYESEDQLPGAFGLTTDQADWQSKGLCGQTDPDMFYPEKGGSTREAKRVCRGCEVRNECLTFALEQDERFGIWGGLSERERRRLKRGTYMPVITELPMGRVTQLVEILANDGDDREAVENGLLEDEGRRSKFVAATLGWYVRTAEPKPTKHGLDLLHKYFTGAKIGEVAGDRGMDSRLTKQIDRLIKFVDENGDDIEDLLEKLWDRSGKIDDVRGVLSVVHRRPKAAKTTEDGPLTEAPAPVTATA